jgi:hypothetical protein
MRRVPIIGPADIRSAPMRRRTLVLAFASALLVPGAAIAQHKSGAGAATVTEAAPFQIVVYGAFRALIHKQDHAAKVQLATAMRAGATEAVGAVSGLRGEITAIDGKLLVTYGTPCPGCRHPDEDHATLLVTGKVAMWRPPVPLPADLVGKDLDEFVIARAKDAGLDVSKPFPVRLKGTLIGVKMHVLRTANPNFKGHGSSHPMADQEDIAAARLDGEVVGFFAPAASQGIIGHPGEPFHYHWVDTARTRTAHLDAFGVTRGAELLLPQR